ncbi:uncharacterized protein [Triticum aestivum]|uniref:uncharacterized protein n=1 Tax=Triticum aestivum TaxID=4565 RepID=UPI001D013A74|nr:uncharacterized protein LOC123095140 [Triticum aestivum]
MPLDPRHPEPASSRRLPVGQPQYPTSVGASPAFLHRAEVAGRRGGPGQAMAPPSSGCQIRRPPVAWDPPTSASAPLHRRPRRARRRLSGHARMQPGPATSSSSSSQAITARIRTTTGAPSCTYPPPGADEETRQRPSLLSVWRPSLCSSAACVMRFSAGAGARNSPASSPHSKTTRGSSSQPLCRPLSSYSDEVPATNGMQYGGVMPCSSPCASHPSIVAIQNNFQCFSEKLM